MDESRPYNFGGGKWLVTTEDEVEIELEEVQSLEGNRLRGIFNCEENRRLNWPSHT